jgi:hypothetical protein
VYNTENALLDEKALEIVVEVKFDAVRLKELEMLTREKELDMQMKLEREKMAHCRRRVYLSRGQF